MNTNRSEQGQVLVFLVLGVIGLLGFAALAIDGGMLLSDRRHAQNSADSSSLAAAGKLTKYLNDNGVTYSQWASCGGWTTGAINLAQAEAINLGSQNGYILDTSIGDGHGVSVVCTNNNLVSYVERHIDIVTRISRDTQTAFAQFIFGGPLRNTVEAIARIRPQMPLAYGHAIVSLNPGPCSGNSYGVNVGGSSITQINGGGVFSNGCLGGNGSTFRVSITNGSLMYVGQLEGTMDCNCADNTQTSPDPVQAPIQLPAESYMVPVPNCSTLPLRTIPNVSGTNINDPTYYTLAPGRYTDSINPSGGREVTFLPGLFCLSGSPNALVLNGGSVTGIGITIYLEQGDVAIAGNVDPTRLEAATPHTAVNGAIPGLLFYMNPNHEGNIDIQGNSSSSYLGTILAPSGDVNISGASGTTPTFNTQIISWNAFISGNATIDINFNDNQNYQIPPSVDLQQ